MCSSDLPPQFETNPVLRANVGFLYRSEFRASDEEGGALTFRVLSAPSWLQFEDLGNGIAALSGVPGIAHIGAQPISIEVTDGQTAVRQDYLLEIRENHKPEFVSSPVSVATEDQPYGYNVLATDPDEDTITLTLISAPSWLTLKKDGNGRARLEGTPKGTDAGEQQVILEAEIGRAHV